MNDDLLALIQAFSEAMGGEATSEELETIRDQMDSFKFRQNVRAALAGINDPERIGIMQDALRKLQRSAESLAAKRSNSREIFRIGGIGGGIGLLGGGLVSIFSVATPAGLLIPIAGAGILVWRAVVDSNHASREIEMLRQIAEIASQLTKDMG